MFDVPKMLYGPRGWADLDDYRLARNQEEEAAAARDGYFRAGEDAREDLVAAGKWHRLPLAPCASAEVDCEITEAFIEAGVAPPKRRGRPPKAERM